MRRGLGWALAVLVWATLSVVWTQSGAAVDESQYNATLALSPSSGPSGTSVQVSGSGYYSGGDVEIRWENETGQLLATIDRPIANGQLPPTNVTIPSASAGAHRIVACSVFPEDFTECENTDETGHGRATFTIQSAAPTTTAHAPVPTSRPSAPPPGGQPTPADPSSTEKPDSEDLATPHPGQFGPHTDLSVRNGKARLPSAGVIPRCAPIGSSNIIDFDDLTEGTDPSESYAGRGVHMTSPEGPLIVARPATGTVSQPQAVVVGSDAAPAVMRITFDSPQYYVGIHMGLPEGRDVESSGYIDLRAQSTTPPLAFGGYHGIDEDRVLVGSDPQPVERCMLVARQERSIRSVDIQLGRYPIYRNNELLGIDRLFFSDREPYQPPERIPAEIRFFAPIHRSSHDAGDDLTIDGIVDTDVPGEPCCRPVDRVRIYWVRWDGSGYEMADARVRQSAGYATRFVLEGVRIPPGRHNVTATATGPGFVATGSIELNGTGPPAPPTSEIVRRGGFDIRPLGVEVTQGVRSKLPPLQRASKSAVRGGPIPTGGSTLSRALAAGANNFTQPDGAIHVADRKTVVRGYASLEYANPPERPPEIPVVARLHGTRNGETLVGSPLLPVNGPVLLRRPARNSADEQLRALRERPDGGWNFVLPDEWSSAGAILLKLEINPVGGPSYIQETTNEYGNSVTVPKVEFAPVAKRDLHIVALNMSWREGDRVRRTQMTYDGLVRSMEFWQKVFPLPDDGLNISSLRGFEMSQDDGEPLAGSRAPSPPIPGSPPWDTPTYTAHLANYEVNGYEDFVALMFSPEAPPGCAGMATIPTFPNPTNPVFWAGNCGATLAQEAAHSVGLTHSSNAHGELRGGGFRDRFTNDHGQLEEGSVGFDTAEMQPIPPFVRQGRSTSHAHDYMSYGLSPKWTSVTAWNDVARSFQRFNRGLPQTPAVNAGVPGGEPMPPLATGNVTPSVGDFELVGKVMREVLVISGATSNEGRHELQGGFLLADPAPSLAGATEGDIYQLALFGADGEVVLTTSFDIRPGAHSPEALGRFSVGVQTDKKLTKAELRRGDDLLAMIESGVGIPRVNLKGLESGDELGVKGMQEIEWTASDPDDDDLSFLVEVSRDGHRWLPVAGPTRSDSAKFDLSALPVTGEDLHLRVQASDGLNVGTAQVDGLHSAPRPPAPIILSPGAGGFVEPQAVVNLRGVAFAATGDRLPDQSLVWLVDGDEVGRGPDAWAAALEEGEHEVALLARQEGHPDGKATTKLIVSNDGDGDRLPDYWEDDNDLDPNDPSDPGRDPDRDTLMNWQEFAEGADPRRLDTDGDLYADNVEVSGGSDPADADSIPMALHGVEGRAVPRLSGAAAGRGRPWWFWVAIGVPALVLAGAGGALLRRRLKPAGAAPAEISTGPSPAKKPAARRRKPWTRRPKGS